MATVTITVCTTCRLAGGATPAPEAGAGDIAESEPPRPGARMLAALGARALPEGVRLRPVECLSACTRGCSIALTGGPGRWSYVYGDLDPDAHADDIVAGAAAYAATEDGLVPWRARPVVFRKQSIARIPPAQLSPQE